MSAIPRNENESFEDYKVRRSEDHENTKVALKGKVFWDSYYQGTYINPKRDAKRAIKSAQQALKSVKGIK